MLNSSVIIIKNHLIFPPSEISVFRDITLYTKIYTSRCLIIESHPQHVDMCYNYLKSYGAFDYVDDIVHPGQETGVVVSDTSPCTIKVRKLWTGNLSRVLNQLVGSTRHKY